MYVTAPLQTVESAGKPIEDDSIFLCVTHSLSSFSKMELPHSMHQVAFSRNSLSSRNWAFIAFIAIYVTQGTLIGPHASGLEIVHTYSSSVFREFLV